MATTSFDFEKPIAEIEEELEKLKARLAEIPEPTEEELQAAEEAIAAIEAAEEARGRKAEAREAEKSDEEEAEGAEGDEEEAEGEESKEEVEEEEEEEPLPEVDPAIAERKALIEQIKELEERLEATKKEVYGNLSAWERVQIARHLERPRLLDYVNMLFTEWSEVHGDRFFGDDKAMVCGYAFFEGQPVAIVGQQKGSNTKENLDRNFGMAHPEGYRKALRVMKNASKFGRPIIVLVDTPGAFPGIGSEERGVAEAIAKNMKEMFALEVPVVVVIIGEGASGGAIGIGIGDAVLMMENSWYTVISPEGCASILWRDAKMAPTAAEALKLTGEDLLKLEIVDEVVPEPLGGAHQDPQAAADSLKTVLTKRLSDLQALSQTDLKKLRYEKYRKIGEIGSVNDEAVAEEESAKA